MRRANYFLVVGGIFFLVVMILAMLFNWLTSQRETQLSRRARVQIKDTIFNVEVAVTSNELALGLASRTALASQSGMLFIMPQRAEYRFWMKEMLISLDIIWIDGDRVVDIDANVPPPQTETAEKDLPIYTPSQPVDKVLELNAGATLQYKIKLGDKVSFLE